MALNDKLRCVQCNVTETPLWRSGPAGPKTLCNACGVRFKKTGRLITPQDRIGKKLAVPLKPKNKKTTASYAVAGAPPRVDIDQARSKTVSTSTASSKGSPISSTSSSVAASTSAVTPARDHNPNVKFFSSQILEDYIRPTVTRLIFPTTDASNYQCLLSGLMVVHRSSRRRISKR